MENFFVGLQNIFTTVFQLNMTASLVIIAVILVRLLLKPAPKIYSYALWSVVLFRLLLPFSFSLPLNLPGIGEKTLAVSKTPLSKVMEMGTTTNLPQNSGVEQPLMTPSVDITTAAAPLDFFTDIVPWIWLLGVAALLFYTVISYILLKRKLHTAILVSENCYETRAVESPFIFGFFSPKIYLPKGISDADKTFVLCHEETHIRRRDYLIKPFAFFALTIHWFNPLVWLSFFLMSKDMEMSCDERVIKTLGMEKKKEYSTSLLSLSSKKALKIGPLSFGESSIKTRIKNILHYKRPAIFVTLLLIILLGILGIFLLANSTSKNENKIEKVNTSVTAFPWKNLSTATSVKIFTDNTTEFENYASHASYETKDKRFIEIIGLLLNQTSTEKEATKEEIDAINRINNYHKTVIFTTEEKTHEYMVILDTLYGKCLLKYEDKYYAMDYDYGRYLLNLTLYGTLTVPYEAEISNLLSNNGWQGEYAFLFAQTSITLPKNLKIKAGEFSDKLYWSHNLELSKDSGFDFTANLGKTIFVEQYCLLDALPTEYEPYKDAFLVVLRNQKRNIVGTYISAGRGGFACSLKRNTFQDISGEDFVSWADKHCYDMKDTGNRNNAKLTPEEVIRKYYAASANTADEACQYLDTATLAELTYMNININNMSPCTTAYKQATFLWTSATVLDIRKGNSIPGESTIRYTVDLEIVGDQFSPNETTSQIRFLTLVKEGTLGWKIAEQGTGP